MFIPDYHNLYLRKQNILKHSSYLNELSFKQLKEALEIQGTVVFNNGKDELRISDVYGISFLLNVCNDLVEGVPIDKEINIHHWEDNGHSIDIFFEGKQVKVVNASLDSKEYIELTAEQFEEQISTILSAVFVMCFSVYYPEIKNEAFFSRLEEMAKPLMP